MRFVTFNIWMDSLAQQRRFHALLGLLDELDPDVVALQEVTQHVLPYLAASPWAAARTLYPASGEGRPGYACVLIGRDSFESARTLPFARTFMARELVVAATPSGWTVATTHLESLEHSAELRAQQLEECFEQLPARGPAVLMGDMNLMRGLDPEPVLPEGWTDAWRAAGRAESEGFTFDPERNPLADRGPERLDRVFLRLEGGWRLRSVDLVGTDEIAPGLMTSDHFGLVCDVDAP